MIPDPPLPLAVALAGFPGSFDSQATGPISGHDWSLLLGVARMNRATGLLAAAVEAGTVTTTHVQAEEIYARHAERMRHVLALEAELLRVHELLLDAGVSVVVLKGIATAHLDHEDPALREFEDIDLLIAPHQIHDAVKVLESAGYRRDLPERRPDADRHFAKDVTLTSPSGAEVDLHRTLTPGAFGHAIDLDDLRAATAPFSLGGVELHALGHERRLLHCAYGLTVAEERPRLATARDLAEIAARHDIDDKLLIALAARWRAASILAEALLLVYSWLGANAVPKTLADWAASQQPSRWERLVRRSYRSAGGTNTTTLLVGAAGLSAWHERVSYMRALLLPSAEYRTARRAAGRPGEWKTGARELLRRGWF